MTNGGASDFSADLLRIAETRSKIT